MSHYSNGYAVAIVCNGNVVDVRQDGQVALPFGKDYVIRLINRNNKRAVAKINVDGQNVSGAGFVVPANGNVDIERPADKAVNFRFASVDSGAAEAHGKAGPDTDGSKGLVTVEWRPEKEIPMWGTGYLGAYAEKRDSSLTRKPPIRHQVNREDCRPRGMSADSDMVSRRVSTGLGAMELCSMEKTQLTSSVPDMMSFSDTGTSSLGRIPQPELSSGVTVEGGHSSQTFRSVHMTIDYTVPVTVTSLKLMGYVESEGIPVNGINYCPACRAKTCKKTDKFCRVCGERF